MRVPGIARGVALAGAAALLSAACSLNPGSEAWPGEPVPAALPAARDEREPCLDRNPQRNAYFGDLHVHTVYSFDANLRGTRGTPDDAYLFARGEPLAIAPYDERGQGLRTFQLERPLDFAAVTDHAEWLGELATCTTPGSAGYDSGACRVFRGEKTGFLQLILGSQTGRMGALVGLSGRKTEVCGDDLSTCRQAVASVWRETRAAAERHYDRSAECRFTSFNAWEYSYTPDRSKTHRNVIFRGTAVPELPLSWIDTPTPLELWRKLEQSCLRAGTGCDAISIPHNPNLSNGRSFTLTYLDEPLEEQRRQARLRAALEPLVEMMQIKGESECLDYPFWETAGAPDELCSFEKRRGQNEAVDDCRGGTGAGGNDLRGCISRLDYIRNALALGLGEQSRIGVNPLKLGLIGSTDTHNATPGATEEWNFPGVNGRTDATPREQLASGVERRNPGGLVGVWAEENSREALFDAMRRRETFATSGTRIQPRLFAGWDLPEDLCEQRDPVGGGYAAGVPMGSDLPRRPRGAKAPAFAVSALRDPGTRQRPGGLLDRVQIVKGWVGDDGQLHHSVHHVAGAERTAAGVDPATCRPRGRGADALCGIWRDPAFDPRRPAVYYARVLENPSCRWQAWVCLGLPEAERPEACSDPDLPWQIQERAWTSPIWYTPPS